MKELYKVEWVDFDARIHEDEFNSPILAVRFFDLLNNRDLVREKKLFRKAGENLTELQFIRIA